MSTEPKLKNRRDARTLLQISLDDFQRNEDGSWVTTRAIEIGGPDDKRVLLGAGRRFNKRELAIFGLDLAAILDRHCT